ncbi:MAG: aldehyde dehydrogenase family protein [Dermatophilus congolensis]|nr:aldehyde dehydrogenase family protein [Dermatophilus congolensis]
MNQADQTATDASAAPTGVEPHSEPGEIAAKVEAARRAFASGRTATMEWRRDQLDAIIRMLNECAGEIEKAVADDLGKCAFEGYFMEVGGTVREAVNARKNLRRWTKDKRVNSLFTAGPSASHVRREPLGTVLIIAPWNYPFRLLLMPLIGAVAAGNSVVLKPSELAPASSALMADLARRYLDPEAIQVIEGGVPETTELLTHRFDHILYTGNAAVGRIVMSAAAKHLTPVTLELGGKSPVWVDETWPMEDAAAAIAWGRFVNAGQTCVAADYVLTTPALAEPLADAIAAATEKMYGPDPASNPEYGRIVNERHTKRLAELLDSGRVVTGGTYDVEARYVAPTVLVDVDPASPAMADEIFGPILPIVAVADHREAINLIRSREKPLAMYAFTSSPEIRRAFEHETSSGALVFGGVMVHMTVPQLPFGGVGESGMGSYNGEQTVRTFSHERSVLRKFRGIDLTTLARPPYKAKNLEILKRF